MILTPTPYAAARFHVNATTKWMYADASDFGPLRDFRGWQRLYDDACDVGIALYNEATGVTTRWYLAEEKTDNEGDLQVTIFKLCSEDLRKNPQLEGWEVHILND